MSTNEQAARDEADREYPLDVGWSDDDHETFVAGAEWAESALLTRLSDPDDALVEAVARPAGRLPDAVRRGSPRRVHEPRSCCVGCGGCPVWQAESKA